MTIKKALRATLRPLYLKLLNALPLRARIVLGYVVTQRRWPNIDAPVGFNEKVLWRKLYDRDPRMPDLVDKLKVKDFLSKTYGADLLIPTTASYDSPEAMDFSAPPLNKPPYVIKTNHGSATNIYIKSHADLTAPDRIRATLAKHLMHDHGATRGEWAYTQVARRIFIEPFIETPEGYLTDFRFHVFDGKVAWIETTTDANGDTHMIFYDRAWNAVPDLTWGYPRFKGEIKRPLQLDAMIQFAEAIGKSFSYIRVDLYEIKGAIKFGELTFYPGAGHDRFDPPSWDFVFGKLWRLPGPTMS